jgi:hypothetical protein
MEFSNGRDQRIGPSHLVGFPQLHCEAFLRFAEVRREVIMFRDVGIQCMGLIEDGFGMKGFRIDTKSCNWGPMAGFVCMDPRLNKSGREKEKFNREQTEHAIEGRVTNLGGGVALEARYAVIDGQTQTTEWAAKARPIVISEGRVRWLVDNGFLDGSTVSQSGNGRPMRAGVSVHSSAKRGQAARAQDLVTLPWRLLRITQQDIVRSGLVPLYGVLPDGEQYGLFVRSDANAPFEQEYPHGVDQLVFTDAEGQEHDPIMGLANPGTEDAGVKSCVTGDYDLFAVWPLAGDFDLAPGYASLGRNFNGAPGRLFGKDERQLGMNPQVWPDLARLQHSNSGNVTPRINEVRAQLNALIQPIFGNPGDQLHHSDEVGNPGGLAKPLAECLPIIAFVPPGENLLIDGHDVSRGGIFGMATMPELTVFAHAVQAAGYRLDVKPNWRKELSLG